MRRKVSRVWPWWGMCGVLLILAGCNSFPVADQLEHLRLQHTERREERARRLRRQEPISPHVLTDASLPTTPVSATKPVPISFDTVLRLAQDQNNQVRLARIKVDEAYADHQMAGNHWLPDLSIGMATYRHDGGIQDFQGNLVKSHYGSAIGGLELTGKYDWKETLYRRVEAERKYWQNKGELSKLTNENLLDASCTYIDLLAARTGVAISMETEARLEDLLQQANKLAAIDSGVRIEVVGVQTQLSAQNVLTVKLREASKAASAKLAYLLGLDPCCELVNVEPRLVPIKLVDPEAPVKTFVDQVLNNGPGVKELEGLLHTVEAARDTNYGWSHWLPSIQVDAIEGGYGAGPGGTINWTGRSDIGVKLLWNTNEFYYAKHKRQQANLNIQQAQLSWHDLRLRLTLGVQEAREASLGGAEQIRLASKHITDAELSYKLSNQRFKENIKGGRPSEVLLALRGLGGARLEYLQAVRDANKAQMRLYALVGIQAAEAK